MILEVEHDGLVLRLRDEGPRTGDVVVLLHGFPQDSGCWDEVVPALHRAGLRTLAPDQRGYSPGARPSAASAYRVETLAEDVLAILDAAHVERAHIVGHDWGGGVAWQLGAAHPERVASLTVLSTPHPRALVRSMVGSLQPLRSWYMLLIQVPALPEALLSRTLARTLRLSGLADEPARRYASRLSTPADLHGPLSWYRAIVRAPWELRDGVGIPGTVTVPTTYAWGAHDPALGRAAAEATGNHVSGPYLFIELDAGHWLPEMHPDEVAEAVLDRVGHS